MRDENLFETAHVMCECDIGPGNRKQVAAVTAATGRIVAAPWE